MLTVYSARKLFGHISRVYADGLSENVTAEIDRDSTVHERCLAKPCCCSVSSFSRSEAGPNCGQQNGIPPAMGLEPSVTESDRVARSCLDL